MPYKKIKVPKKGSKITFKNGKINIPDNPIIPYIEGDGIGVDITPPMINVVNEAVKIAYKIASAGDNVLLSPACASIDLFDNYEDRGRQFKESVRKL